MLRWTFVFLIAALIAGVLGFGVVEGTPARIAKVLFIVFLFLFVIGFLTGGKGAGGVIAGTGASGFQEMSVSEKSISHGAPRLRRAIR